MTTLVVLIVFLIGSLLGLGLALRRMARSRRLVQAVAEPVELRPEHNYAPMDRLFAAHDLAFLKSQPGYRPAMARSLRLERRAVLSLYSRQVLADFRYWWACWRLLAPFSDGPDFGPLAARQVLTFYALYALLRWQCLLGWFWYVRTDVGGLLSIVERLQRTIRQTTGERRAGWQALL